VLAGASKLDAVYIACNATSVVPAIETLRNAGFQGAILGADSFDIPDVDAASKQGAVYFSTHAWFGTGSSAAAQRFAEKYRAQFKAEPTAFSALGYDAMQAMVRAMQSLPAERRTREGVAGALRALAPHAGITGEIAFPNPGYFAAKPVWIVTVEAGSRVRAKHVSPSRIPEPNCAR
jgi:ABC-type branched-subunit amino acid transport system substrate-binding protein